MAAGLRNCCREGKPRARMRSGFSISFRSARPADTPPGRSWRCACDSPPRAGAMTGCKMAATAGKDVRADGARLAKKIPHAAQLRFELELRQVVPVYDPGQHQEVRAGIGDAG